MSRLLPCLLLLACVAAAPAPAAPPPPDPAAALRGVPPGRLLRAHLDDGRVLEGRLATVRDDSLHLADGAGSCALDAIVRLRERRSGSARGVSVGAVGGGVIGALLGAAAGGYVAALDGDDNGVSDAGAVAGGVILGGGTGMVAGGLLGAGLGALGTAWYDLHPAAPPPARAPSRAPGTRLGLRGGLAVTDDFGGRARESGCLGVELPAQLATRLEATGELAWFNLGARIETEHGETFRSSDTVMAGLGLRLTARPRGLSPFVAAGLGWYIRDDGWLGANLGGGVRWQGGSGHAFALELRWHGGRAGGDREPSSGITAVTAGWTFDL